MQCNPTTFATGYVLMFLDIRADYPACRPGAFKNFRQSRVGMAVETKTSKLHSKTELLPD